MEEYKDVITYAGEFNGYDAMIEYYFNDDDLLYYGCYTINGYHPTIKSYITEFDTLYSDFWNESPQRHFSKR